MRIDLTCPVEVLSWELLHDDRAHARAYLHAYNDSDEALVRLEGCVRWIEADSGNYTETSFTMDKMHIAGRSAFTMPTSSSFVPENVRLLVYFTRVLLSDGSEWIGSAETLGQYADAPVLPGHMANALAAEAGPDAVCCAWERENGEWQCVCGRWNPRDAQSCMRCRRDRADTLARFHPEAVERLSPGLGPVDIEPPLTEMHHARRPSAPHKPKKPLVRILTAVLLAALCAFAALQVRTWRYEQTHGAGLMPTSHATESMDT